MKVLERTRLRYHPLATDFTCKVFPALTLSTAFFRCYIMHEGLVDKTCLSFGCDHLGGFAAFKGPDVNRVEDARPQTRQPVRGAVRSDWHFLI